jgi:predicted RNA-binding Zn-ribbon protein involved in translation (DUF1610 family)
MSNMIKSGTAQAPIKIHIEKDTHECRCPHCGSAVFTTVAAVRRIPGLLVGQSRDQFQPFSLFQCNNCKKIVNFEETRGEFEPKSVKILRVLGQIFQTVLPFLQKKR